MKAFAQLLDGLSTQSGRNSKIRLLTDYFRSTPDPDRGFGLAALCGDLRLQTAKPGVIGELAQTRVDPVLFAMSYDYVGDLAETTALIWPDGEDRRADPPRLGAVIEMLNTAGRSALPATLGRLLDSLDATERWALLKLITGALRVGVSARLAKVALAEAMDVPVAAVEEVWHAVAAPYGALFDWLEGRAAAPDVTSAPVFRPLMLAHPLDAEELERLDPAAYRAEWKWDGIRVQLVAIGGARRLYSRTGDDISGAFPDLVEAMSFDGVVDGELLVVRDGVVAPFNDLQPRLGRKRVSAALLRDRPAHVRLYDILFDDGEDLRDLAFTDRRQRLEAWHGRVQPERMDLSELLPFDDWPTLGALRDGAREAEIEGLMLKRIDSPYTAGRPKGPWFKWKRNPLLIDAVVMYAQRGHGKRSSLYSDYTFGCWRPGEDGPELVPVGKAYFGFTDDELGQLDKWIRQHTVNRFGPVREVSPGLVFEVAFDSVHPSKRHKSGLAMRFPRVHRIRWDKPAEEADALTSLAKLAKATPSAIHSSM